MKKQRIRATTPDWSKGLDSVEPLLDGRPLSAEVLTRFVDSIQDGVIVTDAAGRVTYLNEAGENMFGFTPNQVSGKPISTLDVMKLPLGSDAAFTDAIVSAGSWEGYTAGIHKDGSSFPVSVSILSLVDPAGDLLGFAAIYRDAQNLEDLRDALALARAANRTRRQIINSITHEFRTPLAAMVGFAELLSGMDDIPPSGHDFLKAIRSSAERLSDLVESVIEYASVQAGQLAMCADDYEIRPRLDGLSMKPRQRLASRRIAWELTIDDSVPESIVIDAEKLERVLTVLLDNAEKFTPSGSIRLAVNRSRAVPAMIEFRVTDTGIGFDATITEELFEPFRQIDDGLNRRYSGIGLGLALARQLAEMMGGTLTSTGAVGEGSTFVLTIPTRPPQPAVS